MHHVRLHASQSLRLLQVTSDIYDDVEQQNSALDNAVSYFLLSHPPHSLISSYQLSLFALLLCGPMSPHLTSYTLHALRPQRDAFSSFGNSLAQSSRRAGQAFGLTPGGVKQWRTIGYCAAAVIGLWILWKILGWFWPSSATSP